MSGDILFVKQDIRICNHHPQSKVYYHKVHHQQDPESARYFNGNRQVNLQQEGFFIKTSLMDS